MTEAASLKASVLVEALPYIRRFVGKTVVVKYGGNALAGTSDHDALSLFAEDIVLMRLVGMRPVVVHGGGPQISELMERLGKKPEFVDGLRVTDAETVDIARMVLKGQVNPQLVAAINVHGRFAVGISGVDAGLIRATARDPKLGFVGDVTAINPEVIHGLIDDEFIPVIATIGSDETGPGLQHQRRHRRRRHRRGARRREAGLSHRHRRPSTRCRRRRQPDPPGDRRRTRPTRRRRRDRRRHDSEGRQLHPRGAQRRAPCPHPRRPHRPRAAARDLHRCRHRHHDHERTDHERTDHERTGGPLR